MRRRYAWGVTLLLIANACSGSSSGVQWGDYEPSIQQRIDALAISKDCAGLQAEFDTADANNAATLTRTGHNNAKLMAYVNDKMKTADCV